MPHQILTPEEWDQAKDPTYIYERPIIQFSSDEFDLLVEILHRINTALKLTKVEDEELYVGRCTFHMHPESTQHTTFQHLIEDLWTVYEKRIQHHRPPYPHKKTRRNP